MAQHRWHALFCDECRRAGGRPSDRRADATLARGAGTFRRALGRATAPPGLDEQILERLGLAAEAKPAGRRVAYLSPRWALSGAAVVLVAFGGVALIMRGALAPTDGGSRMVAVPNPPSAETTRMRDERGPVRTQTLAQGGPGGLVREADGPLPPVGSPWFGGSAAGSAIAAARPMAPPFRGASEAAGPPEGGVDVGPPRRPVAPRPGLSRSVDPRPGSAATGRRDDLAFLNGNPLEVVRLWSPMPMQAQNAIERWLDRNVKAKDDFVQIPLPRIAGISDGQIAAAVAGYKREAAVMDPRLFRKVTLGFKATALSDLCDHLRNTSGIQLAAGASVADEKVTIFCKEMPLRDVMRQLSRPFGYAWTRSGKAGEYKYELVQDLKSQLVEEELRERDHREALLAMEREMERYRPYLHLSPDEARARAKSAPPAEKQLLEKFAGYAWGPIQMYFRAGSAGLAALRAGKTLVYSQEPKEKEQPLPADVARGVLQSFHEWRVVRLDDGRVAYGPASVVGSGGVPTPQSPDARARVTVDLVETELGSMSIGGLSGVFGAGKLREFWSSQMGSGWYATGKSPAVAKPQNSRLNASLARDPALGRPVTLRPEPVCRPDEAYGAGHTAQIPEPKARSQERREAPGGSGPSAEPKVTTAEVLEALHRATGKPLVGDFYTRLYPISVATVRNAKLFDALNRVGDSMRLRWSKDGEWLQFRTTSFYDDRVKEAPNRLLTRWSAARRRQGALTLDDLIEIAQLTKPQLDGAEMAEGAELCWGLKEWKLASHRDARPHLRYLAGFTPEQRQAAMSPSGLAFVRMSLAQQQQFLALATKSDFEPLHSLSELEGAALRVEYTVPGGFQWGDPARYGTWMNWVVAVEPGKNGRRVFRPILKGRTREEVLQALLQLDPKVREAAFQSPVEAQKAPDERIRPASGSGPGAGVDRSTRPRAGGDRSPRRTDIDSALEAQIFPTELRLSFIYMPGVANSRQIRITSGGMTNYQASW
jgi:hypothetical protein